MRKTRLLLIIALLFAFLPTLVLAYEVRTDTSIFIAKDEIIDGNFYAVGNSITIDGNIKGDVFCAGQSININGSVEGDVFCAGQSININGNIGGSVRLIGNQVNINNQVAHNVYTFGSSLNLGSESQVGWDLFFIGTTGEFRGKIDGNLHGAASSIIIAGDVSKDVKFRLNARMKDKNGFKGNSPLMVTNSAKINGNLYYTAGTKGIIEDDAQINGNVGYSLPDKKQAAGMFSMVWFWSKLFSVFGALVVGLVLISLWREEIKKLTDNMLLHINPAIGWGMVMMFLTPVIIFLLLITLIGIPLAIILAALWLIALYIAKILTAILFGRSILRKMQGEKQSSLIIAMVIGVILAWVIYSLPLLGWIFGLASLWWGLGGIWLYFKKG